MAESLRAYSLGYEGISLEQYVRVLKAHNISTVLDVRETPWSYKPGFSKKPLAERLGSEGIRYLHMKSAGNPSRNRKMGLSQTAVIDLYKVHLAANSACLDDIYNLISEEHGAVCLLCFERHPNDCHRKVILDSIADNKRNLITCHLSGQLSASEEPIIPQRVPKPDDCERLRIHVKVSQDESSFILV